MKFDVTKVISGFGILKIGSRLADNELIYGWGSASLEELKLHVENTKSVQVGGDTPYIACVDLAVGTDVTVVSYFYEDTARSCKYPLPPLFMQYGGFNTRPINQHRGNLRQCRSISDMKEAVINIDFSKLEERVFSAQIKEKEKYKMKFDVTKVVVNGSDSIIARIRQGEKIYGWTSESLDALHSYVEHDKSILLSRDGDSAWSRVFMLQYGENILRTYFYEDTDRKFQEDMDAVRKLKDYPYTPMDLSGELTGELDEDVRKTLDYLFGARLQSAKQSGNIVEVEINRGTPPKPFCSFRSENIEFTNRAHTSLGGSSTETATHEWYAEKQKAWIADYEVKVGDWMFVKCRFKANAWGAKCHAWNVNKYKANMYHKFCKVTAILEDRVMLQDSKTLRTYAFPVYVLHRETIKEKYLRQCTERKAEADLPNSPKWYETQQALWVARNNIKIGTYLTPNREFEEDAYGSSVLGTGACKAKLDSIGGMFKVVRVNESCIVLNVHGRDKSYPYLALSIPSNSEIDYSTKQASFIKLNNLKVGDWAYTKSVNNPKRCWITKIEPLAIVVRDYKILTVGARHSVTTFSEEKYNLVYTDIIAVKPQGV